MESTSLVKVKVVMGEQPARARELLGALPERGTTSACTTETRFSPQNRSRVIIRVIRPHTVQCDRTVEYIHPELSSSGEYKYLVVHNYKKVWTNGQIQQRSAASPLVR